MSAESHLFWDSQHHQCQSPLQFVASTEDWRSLKATGLADHPNVSVATYQAPYSESKLRETINGYRGSPLHAVLETFFNIRDYSDAMLTDRRLFCQVQVSCSTSETHTFSTAHSVRLQSVLRSCCCIPCSICMSFLRVLHGSAGCMQGDHHLQRILLLDKATLRACLFL